VPEAGAASLGPDSCDARARSARVQNGRMTRRLSTVMIAVGLLAVASCSSSKQLSSSPLATDMSSTSTPDVVSTTIEATTIEPASTATETTAPETSAVVDTTIPAATIPETTALESTTAPTVAETAPPETAPPETAPPETVPETSPPGPPITGPPASAGTCPGLTAIPGDATNIVTISGDIDGDLNPDQVTSYTDANDVPHIHAVLAFGKESDVEIPLGFSDTVSISFEDFDHSAGAQIPPPVAVLALAQGNAGSEFAAFLTLTTKYCIKAWTQGNLMFVVRVSQLGPFNGLLCDHTAGHTHYLQVSAEQQPDSSWLITSSEITHNFTKAKLTPLDDQIVPDDPNIAHEYGDIVNCDHAPIFP
jgi:hypothetical protein